MLKKHCSYHFCIAITVIIVTSPMSVAEELATPSLIVEASVSITKEHADQPPVVDTPKPQIETGKVLFNNLCKHCHTITYDESAIGAPGLRSVLERHDEAWLHQWIKNPATFAKTNVAARDLIDSNQFGLAMPTLPMMQDDANRSAIIEYLRTIK